MEKYREYFEYLDTVQWDAENSIASAISFLSYEFGLSWGEAYTVIDYWTDNCSSRK
jgi:hypothetical protein